MRSVTDLSSPSAGGGAGSRGDPQDYHPFPAQILLRPSGDSAGGITGIAFGFFWNSAICFRMFISSKFAENFSAEVALPEAKIACAILETRRSYSNVPRLRISVVQYLNTAPLVYGFTHGPLRGKYELSFTVPSECAEALRSGAADVAIIPSIEYQRIDGLVMLPDIAIASKNEVRSLLVIAKRPIGGVRKIALDCSSRTTQAMVRILCAEHWKIAPEFRELPPNLQEMLQEADAALLIGDPALRLSVALKAGGWLGPEGETVSQGRLAGIANAERLHVYDVVQEWRRMRNLSAVLAVWGMRREAADAEVIADFTASRDYGMARIAEISEEASRELNLPAPTLASYLTWNIDFSLNGENRRGLEHFYARCAALGLIAKRKPIEWAVDLSALEKVRAK